MNDVDDLLISAIENTAGRNNQLAIRQATEFRGDRAHLRESPKPSHGSEHPLDQPLSGLRFVQRYIICDRIQLLNRRIGPNYFSHRFSRCFAWT